jgi:hypothetical protein
MKSLKEVSTVLNSDNEVKTIQQCRIILNFDKTKLNKKAYSYFASYE